MISDPPRVETAAPTSSEVLSTTDFVIPDGKEVIFKFDTAPGMPFNTVWTILPLFKFLAEPTFIELALIFFFFCYLRF